MKRTRERDIDVIKSELKETRSRLSVLESELHNHVITKAKRTQEAADRLRKTLPDFLFNRLVMESDPVHGALTRLSWHGSSSYDNDEVSFFTWISTTFQTTGAQEFKFYTNDGVIEPREDIVGFKEPVFNKSIEKLWAKAMKTNKQDVRRALAAVMTCVARKMGEPEPTRWAIRTMFDGPSV